MPDTTPSVPADVVQAAELIHRDIAEAMDVIYGEIGGMDDTPEDVDATSKRIADDIRIVLNWVLAQAQPAPISPVGADTTRRDGALTLAMAAARKVSVLPPAPHIVIAMLDALAEAGHLAQAPTVTTDQLWAIAQATDRFEWGSNDEDEGESMPNSAVERQVERTREALRAAGIAVSASGEVPQ